MISIIKENPQEEEVQAGYLVAIARYRLVHRHKVLGAHKETVIELRGDELPGVITLIMTLDHMPIYVIILISVQIPLYGLCIFFVYLFDRNGAIRDSLTPEDFAIPLQCSKVQFLLNKIQNLFCFRTGLPFCF